MKIATLIKGKGLEVIGVDGDSAVADAISKMVERNIGAVLVMDGGQTIGMFTERDVLKCWARGDDFTKTKVSKVMTRELLVARADDDLSYVMSIMIQKGVRHLPVVDKGAVVSVLSIRDVVRAQVDNLEAEVHYLKEFITSAG